MKGHVFTDGDLEEMLDNVIMSGEYTALKKQYQFFPTPRPVAKKMCELAELSSTSEVLEPSCGKGDLADVIFEAEVKQIFGIELNPQMGKYLDKKPYKAVVGVDFLEYARTAERDWPRIVMNPPFSHQQDIDHILAAYSILQSGGILVSVMSESAFSRNNRKSLEVQHFFEECNAEWEKNAEGAFKKSGTMIRTRLVKINKPSNG